MTETQSIDHAAPLGPGEIRTHTVGTKTFKVMHVAGGSFTQASVRDAEFPGTVVLKTDTFDRVAVQVYADAIAQAELDQIDADEEWAAPMVIGSTPTVRAEDGTPDADVMFNTPMGANPVLVTGEQPGTSLRELVEAYGEAMAKGAIEISYVDLRGDVDDAAVRRHANRADALKAEIFKRYGGSA